MGIDHERIRSPSGRYRLLLWLLLAGLGLVGVQVTHAATWRDGGGWNAAPLTQGGDGVFSVLPDSSSPNNSHVSTCTPTSCSRTGDLPAPRGRGNPRLSPSATFPKAAVVTGALALGSRALPWLTAGKALYDWYQAANVGVDPQGEFTEVTGATTGGSTRWQNSSPMGSLPVSTVFSSPGAVCSAYLAAANEVNAADTTLQSFNLSVSLQNVTATNASCRITGPWVKKTGSTGNYNYVLSASKNSDLASCFDTNGRFVALPTGGICPQGTSVPLSAATAEQRLNNAPITADVLKRSLEEVLKAGGALQDTGTHSVTGPSSVPGETKTRTTTSPSGVTQVTTVTNNYNYNYAGNTVTITTTEVIQNPDGSTEETTSDAVPPDQCEKNPTSAACTQLGTPPSAELPEATKTVSFTPVSFSANQSCPGPVQFNALGRQLEFSYAPMCDTISTWIRALVLAGCAFIAAFVFIGGLKA